MKKLIVASNNENKIREIKQILFKFPIEIMSLKEAGIEADVEETADTFEGNAYLKAESIYKLSPDCMVLADDSGLMVDALGGAPGVYSARFSGEHGNDKANNEKLLKLLQDKAFEERKAKFICAMVFIVDYSKIITVRGEVEGYISLKESGEDGFGYDPLFYLPEYNMTFGEMDKDVKNSISHRAKALEKLNEEISKVL